MKLTTTILRNKNFLSYWSGGLVSALGDAMFLMALNWLVVEKTGSGLILGTIMACISLPQILLVTIGGVVADRLNPKWVMIASDTVRGLVMVFLFVMSPRGLPPIWTLFVMAIVYGCIAAPHKDNSPSIWVFDGDSILFPIWIFRRDGRISHGSQSLHNLVDCTQVRNIKHQ